MTEYKLDGTRWRSAYKRDGSRCVRETPATLDEVAKPGQGDTPDNPIPYSGNMELFEGKYYSEDGVTYRCTRSTGIPVYNRLADLVGLYVEVV